MVLFLFLGGENVANYDGRIRINTEINTRGLRHGEVDIRRSMSRISDAAKKMAAVIASAFAVGKIAQFGKKALDAASDFEAMEAQFSQVFGELEEVAAKSLSNIESQTGIVEERMKSSYTKIAAFAKTAGMDTASSMNLANRAMVAVADSAAFYDRSLEETTESLQSFLKGNYENDAALGLSATEFTRNAAANKLYGKSFIELSESQKQLTLLQMVEDANKLSGAMGQAARESDTWTNQIGNLKQAWTNLMANIGRLVLPVATKAVKLISNVINSLSAMIARLSTAAGAFRSFSELLTGNKASSGNAGTSAPVSGSDYSDAAAGAEQLADATEDTAKATKKAKKEAKGYLSSLDEIKRYSDEYSSGTDSSGVVGGSGAGVGSETGNVDYGSLAEGETVIDKMSRTTEKLKEILSGLFKPFMNAWEKEGAQTVAAAKAALENIGALSKNVGKSLYEVWTNGTGTNMLTVILQIAQNVLTTVGNIAERLKEAWDKNAVGTTIIQNIANIFQRILDFVNRIWQATADWAASLDFYPILESIKNLTEKIEPIVKRIGDDLSWIYEKIVLPLTKYLLEKGIPFLINKLSEFFGFLSSNKGTIEAIGAGLLAAFAAKKVISGITSIVGAVKNFMSLIRGAGGLLSLLTGSGGIVLAIGAVVAAGVLLYQNWDEICAAGKKIWSDLQKTLSRTWENIKTNASNMWKGITGFLGKTWDGLKSTASTVFSGIGKVAVGAWDGISKAVSNLCQMIQTNFPKALDAAMSIIKKPINGIISLINGLINGVVTGINYVLEAFNHLRISVPSWVPGIGGKKLGFNFGMLTAPQIPYLASGAVIPPNAPFMAVLGDQKHGTNIESPLAVIEDAVERALSKHQNTGGNGNYTFIGQINRRVLFEEVISEAVIQQTVRGKNPFLLGG